MSGSAFAVTHYAFSSGAGRTSDGNGSHASTLKSPSYTKSVSWQHHPQLNNITDAPWFCGDTTWYWKENFPHAYEVIYGNYQNNVLANIIFVDFQQQGERGLTNAPDEDPDDLSTGYYGSAYRSPENWTTALRSSHFSAAARRGIISDRFVEAILQFWRER